MHKVLVTGSTGFIGPHLVRALCEAEHEVTCLVRPASQVNRLPFDQVRIAFGDITDVPSLREALTGVDVVFHLAGRTKALRRDELMYINADGTRNVASVCAEQSQPPVLIVVSSLAAAGPSQPDHLRTETDPVRPVSHYGRSKRAGELAVEEFCERVPTSIVRPPIVFGEGDAAMAEMFRPIAKMGLHFVPGFVPHRFSLVHADDLARLLMLVAEKGKRLGRPPAASAMSAGQYFAAGDEHPTYTELGHMIGRALNKPRVRIIRVPKRGAWVVGAFNDLRARMTGRPAVMSIDKAREALAGSWTCSGERAREEVGFEPAADLLTRLTQTARWYQDHGWL